LSRSTKTVITYTCDHCGKHVEGEPSQIFQVETRGVGPDCFSFDRVTIQSERSYAYTFAESTLCDDCKWKILEKLVDGHRMAHV